MTEGAGGLPAIGIMVEHELPGKKKLVLQTHVAQDVEVDLFKEVMDKVQNAADRQFARYMIDPLRLELKAQQRQLEDHVARVEDFERRMNEKAQKSDRRGGYQPSPAEDKEKQQTYAITDSIKKRIAELEADLLRFEEKAK